MMHVIALAASVTFSVILAWAFTGFQGNCRLIDHVALCMMVIPW